jgi:uncharacterized protein YndB with AHSA1/START domain
MPEHQYGVTIGAPPAAVWEALTTPELMKQWMGEPEMDVAVETDWVVGGPIRVTGFHHARFENRGTVLRFEPNQELRYSHLDSVSRLPDVPENYSVIDFRLTPVEGGTSLTVTLSGFPTESILKHLEFYWRGTIGVFKKFVERR